MGDAAVAACEEKDFKAGLSDDWEQLSASAGLRKRLDAAVQRRDQRQQPARQTEDEDEDDDAAFEEEDARYGRRCCLSLLAFVLALLIVGAYQAYLWMNPLPMSCTIDIMRPQKFKVDVTDFFAPRISAAAQFVLSIKNSNVLRQMLLEQCKLTVYEAATGLKLGSVQQSSLVLSPFTTTSATLSLQGLGGNLAAPEQRRLAGIFLSKKALLLTIVATASSRVGQLPAPPFFKPHPAPSLNLADSAAVASPRASDRP